MKTADFEETEFRGPLFNQLENGNHLLWEPGQVFEQYIGIDRALYCTLAYLWNIKGYNQVLEGAILSHFRWNFIWKKRKSKKLLPNFNLNLFIQAKRPYFNSRSKNALMNKGLNGKHWSFEVTSHQQEALEKVAIKLKGKALVVYASPAFHKQSELYKHTINKSIVEYSTFPDVIELSGHTIWYYNKGGATGITNPDYANVDQPNLNSRIYQLIENSKESNQDNFFNSINELSSNIISSLSNEQIKSRFEVARFFDELLIIDRHIRGYELDNEIDIVKNFLTVVAFTNIFKLVWFTISKSS